MTEIYQPVEERTAPGPLRNPDEVIDRYVACFNRHDEELRHGGVPNALAAEWMKREVPFFECADSLLERVYWFRWWVFRKHIVNTPDGHIITEFLPDVYWSGAYNSINCASGHHIAEARWLRGGKELIREYVNFWFKGPGDELSYSSWVIDAIVRYAELRDDRELAVGLLDEFVRFYRTVEDRNMTRYGLFWSYDDRDAMEDSISGSGLRPTLNSYMAANARAIATIARWAGHDTLAFEYDTKADTLTDLIRTYLWDKDADFFKVIPLNDKDDALASMDFADVDPGRNVREEIGYIPWAFGLADNAHEKAWSWLNDSDYFAGAVGIRTAEINHPRYMNRESAHECQWNGPCWPFATTQTLNSMLAEIRSGRGALSADDFMRELRRYAAIHTRQRDDGEIVDWLDEDLDADTGAWISRDQLEAWGWRDDKGGYERGKDYNHSAFADLIISGLAGLRVDEHADATVLVVEPLAAGRSMPYWRLLGVPVRGHSVDVLYDREGDRYGCGVGLTVRVDGVECHDVGESRDGVQVVLARQARKESIR
ncbi:MGH1-like glycoside hydrolase domain-containing protein [Bifidobacterium oedipodis]|uniref:Mannosylglycerate hydrolase MGH1-like glycoside hydrolase domain-containing protein n=1 Tax=Bifidobacterium oedipodis TaxID=2675322 RepID=A0A7Y0EQL0_9BIFI|nr:hypothetical protein [Bifidobacterium sp. DSM 109957]NMM94610.1 hypothetical protein [Bifidobacterium sp. DSM 109957]